MAPALVLGGTDSRVFSGRADDVYRFQPVRLKLAELDMIHGTNETMSLENLRRMTDFYTRLIATAAGSEHPNPSSPAQGAAYTAELLDALTADPKVWARTALFVMFDENDGFFDHIPPPAPPSRGKGRASWCMWTQAPPTRPWACTT